MNNIILNFLDSYKNLDELCKQILSSDVGVTQYIEEMEKEINGSYYVKDWEKDYKRLKHIRWVRNKLVHDTHSFENKIVTTDDIDWLREFQARIIKCTDPFSLLNQMRSQVDSNINGTLSQTRYHNNTKKNKTSNRGVLTVVIILAIVLLVSIFVIPILLSAFNYIGNYSYEGIAVGSTQNEVDFETLTFSGENSATIKNINVPNGNYYIIGKYYGEGNFVAELHKSVGDNLGQLIANKISACEAIYGFQGPIENGYINVENASGKWEFTIIACEIISDDNLTEQYTYAGSGAKVNPNINLPNGEYYITCTYNGVGNFAVTFYNSISNNYGDLIANEIGETEVTYGIQGPITHGYIDIDMADGDWTITIEPCNN